MPENATAQNATTLRDRVIKYALPLVSEHGWHWSVIEEGANKAGVQSDIVQSLFPAGVSDAVAHFSDYMDRTMLTALRNVPYDALRVRDRIRTAVVTRLTCYKDHKEVVRHTIAFWALPVHVIQGQRVLWRSSDRIWNWAGDTATDYTKQTKRASLASILLGTTMVWITDESQDNLLTTTFLDRRIQNVMEIGRAIGTMKAVIPNLFRQANRS